MAALEHPLKAEIEALRRLMAATDPAITEEIKWNSLTFRTTESFATVHLRATERLQVILHLGAKARPRLPNLSLDDPAGLVKWLAADRCRLDLAPEPGLKTQAGACQAIIRQWLRFV